MFVNTIALNSRDSISPENFRPYWTINLSHFSLPQAHHKVSVSQVQFPNTVYPVNEYYDTVCFIESTSPGVTLTAVLTHNNYTGTQMAAELQSKLNAAGTLTYTVSYDSQSKKITTSVAANTFLWCTAQTNAYTLLGITTFNVSQASIVGDAPINLSGTAYVDLISNFPTQHHSSTHSTNLLVRIPVYHSFGNIIVYEAPINHWLKVEVKDLTRIHMELRDDRGNLFKLPSNSYVTVVLKVQTKDLQ